MRLLVLLLPLLSAANGIDTDFIFTTCHYAVDSWCVTESREDGGVSTVATQTLNVPSTMLAYYSFDSLYDIDESGHFVNLHPSHPKGPDCCGGSGGSLWLRSKTHSVSSEPAVVTLGGSFSVLMYVFIETPVDGQTKTLLHLGDKLRLGVLAVAGGRIRVVGRFGTPPKSCTLEDITGSGFVTDAGFMSETWAHIAVVNHKGQVSVFVNGFRVYHHQGSLSEDAAVPVVIGKSDDMPCDSAIAFIDEIRIHAKVLTPPEVGAAVLPRFRSLAGDSSLTFAGANVDQDVLKDICRGEWSLCADETLSKISLDSLIWSLGLFGVSPTNPRLWTMSALEDSNNGNPELGLAICCPRAELPAATNTTVAADANAKCIK